MMKKAILILSVICLFMTPCYAGVRPKKEVKKGNLLYNNGEFNEALKQYEEAILKDPDSDVVNFNIGAALYKTEDYKAAMRHFERSLVTEEKTLEAIADYNLGNAEYKYGISKETENVEEAIGLLKRSLGHYEKAIALNSDDEDAKFNYDFVKEELERLLKKKEKEEKEKKEEKKEEENDQEEKEEPSEGNKSEDEKEEKKPEEERSTEEEEKEEPVDEKKDKPEEEKPRPGEAKEEDKGPELKAGEMSEKEAEMLLENYRYQEEPRGLYKEEISQGGLPEVLKDW